MPQATLIPDLAHRTPSNTYLTDLVERLTPEWIDEHFDRVMAMVDAAGDDPAAWVEAFRFSNELSSHLSTHFARARLAFRQDSEDPGIVAENRRVNSELAPVWTRRAIELVRALVGSDAAMRAIEEQFGALTVQQLRVEQRTSDPVNIDLQTRLSDVLMQYTSIFAKATITWRGEQLPYSYARKAAHDEDPVERRAAHESVLAYVRQQEGQLQEIYDEALDIRTQMATNLGLSSYPALRYQEMERFDWGPEDAERFRAAIERHLVPLTVQLRSQQAKALGGELVHPADLEIWTDPAPELRVSVDEQLEVASRVFNRLGAEFGAPFDLLVKEGLIDLPARPGKGTGAFCTGFADQRVPYLFCNSVGAPDDVTTLVHEYGHGLQAWRSRDIELVQLRHPTLEACEIHSMTLELLVHPYVEEFFGDDADRYRARDHRSSVLLMPYVASVDHFQHEVYAAGRERPLTADERSDLWVELGRRYRPGIDWDASPDSLRLRWLQQLHIFQSPFYYLDYALAQMVSWQLWLDSLDDREAALERYLNLCSMGGRASFRELVLDAGLDDPFDESTVARTVQRLAPQLGLEA